MSQFSMTLHDEDMIIGEPNSVNILVDALRQASSEMQESNNHIESSVQPFRYQDNDNNPSSAVESEEITEDQKEKALQVLSLIIKEAQCQRFDGSVVSSQLVRSAVQSRSDLHKSINNHLADLVRMGCLIPCCSKRGLIEKNKYIVSYLNGDTRYDIESQNGSGIQVKHVPVLRIQIEVHSGRLHHLSALLIPSIVSECMKSWCVAKRGKYELISRISVAFSANHNATRLVASIKDDSIFLFVFEYSEMADRKSIDKKLCRQFFQHVENALKRFFHMRATLTCSIRCVETEGDLEGENGWMDVDEMNQHDKPYFCTSHNKKDRHRVQLTDTLYVWFSKQVCAYNILTLYHVILTFNIFPNDKFWTLPN